MRFLEVSFYALVVYFFFFHILADSYFIIAYNDLVWAVDVGERDSHTDILPLKNSPKFQENFYYFKKNILYLNQNGDIIHRVKLDNDDLASVGKKNYVTYQKVGDAITLFNTQGNMLWRYNTFSYPFLSPSGNRILLLSTDNSSISILDRERSVLLSQKFLSSMILDFVFCEFNDSLAIGTIEGRLIVYDYRGKGILDTEITGSKFNYVKSVAISEKGEYFACLAGLFPEYLVLFDTKGKVLWKRETEKARRKKTYIYINKENHQLLEQGERSILVRHLKSGDIRFAIPLDILGVKEIVFLKAAFRKDQILVLVNTDENPLVLLFSTQGEILWKKEFYDRYLLKAEFNQAGDSFLIKSNEKIYCYRIVRYE